MDINVIISRRWVLIGGSVSEPHAFVGSAYGGRNLHSLRLQHIQNAACSPYATLTDIQSVGPARDLATCMKHSSCTL